MLIRTEDSLMRVVTFKIEPLVTEPVWHHFGQKWFVPKNVRVRIQSGRLHSVEVFGPRIKTDGELDHDRLGEWQWTNYRDHDALPEESPLVAREAVRLALAGTSPEFREAA